MGSNGGGLDEERRNDGLSQRLGQHTSQKTAVFAGRRDAQVQPYREEAFLWGFLRCKFVIAALGIPTLPRLRDVCCTIDLMEFFCPSLLDIPCGATFSAL